MALNDLGIVRTGIRRADRAAVDQLARFGVATIHEAMGRVGLMAPYMHPISPGARLRAGELGLDIYGMQDALAQKGLRYEEAPGG